ncbi:TPA: hypothetical protein U2C01_000773, partial [Streptococcus suis]|nr:hypothetical protein [Streptococcus suis]
LATGLSVFGSEVQADEIVTATRPAEAEAVSSTTSSQPVTAQDVQMRRQWLMKPVK